MVVAIEHHGSNIVQQVSAVRGASEENMVVSSMRLLCSECERVCLDDGWAEDIHSRLPELS
eukprot:12886216-Prorocentrum_lima.AAC.1